MPVVINSPSIEKYFFYDETHIHIISVIYSPILVIYAVGFGSERFRSYVL